LIEVMLLYGIGYRDSIQNTSIGTGPSDRYYYSQSHEYSE
jgi:hypothetical protein